MAVDEEEIREWLFELFIKRAHLDSFEQPLFELATVCETREEFGVLKHTADQLVALSNDQYVRCRNRLAAVIRESIVGDEKVAIVAMAWGEKPDSSQRLAQSLKVVFRSNKNVSFFQ